jgi:hypothetical protein
MHAADVQDRDGGALLMASLFGAFPFLIKLYADGGYQGPEFQSATKRILAHITVEIVKRSGQPQASSRCPSAGSSNAPSAGSAAADDWPRTGNAGIVMSGRIWTPPDCNGFGRRWLEVTTADVYPAS